MKKIRIIIDVVMYIFFIVLMGHHITGNLIHEILGTGIIILFIIHNLLNIKFYKTVFKGKYNLRRMLLTIIDALLLLSMIGIIVSSMIISNDVFAFFNIQTTSFGLKLHMISTSWGFMVMSIHLGLHLNSLINKINKKMKRSTFEYLYYLVFYMFLVYGVYSLIKLNILSDMFLLNPFKAYVFDEKQVVFYLHVISSSLSISLTIYLLNKIRKEKK